MLLWLLCVLIICFRNQKPILLFIGVSTIIYLVIKFVNDHQLEKLQRSKDIKEINDVAITKKLLLESFQQWQEIDGPQAFISHPTLISIYYHLCGKASTAQMRDDIRYSIRFAERYLQPDVTSKERRDALYNCIKYLDVFINDPIYSDTVVLLHDYLSEAVTVPPQ